MDVPQTLSSEIVDASMPSATAATVTESLPVSSKNSMVAKNGFRAEVAICEQEDVKQSLEVYFNLPITRFKRVHGKNTIS